MYKVSGTTKGIPLSTYYTDSKAEALNLRNKYGRGVQITEEESPRGMFTVVGRARGGYPIATRYFDSYADALNAANRLGGSAKPARA